LTSATQTHWACKDLTTVWRCSDRHEFPDVSSKIIHGEMTAHGKPALYNNPWRPHRVEYLGTRNFNQATAIRRESPPTIGQLSPIVASKYIFCPHQGSIKTQQSCRSSIVTPLRAHPPRAMTSRSPIRPTGATHCSGAAPHIRPTHLDLQHLQDPRNQAHRTIAVVTIASSSVLPRTRRFKLPANGFSVPKPRSAKQIRRS
jgi:hypothetical protein